MRMTSQQAEVVDFLHKILNDVSDNQVYRHLRATIGDHQVYIEDLRTSLFVSTREFGTLIDIERCVSPTAEPHFDVLKWRHEILDELIPLLQQHYVLELMSQV
ncbi:MAG: hypothetical protein AB7L09_00580 [Nitrospira sp.]